MNAVRRLYVRAPNWVGDFVMATGALDRIRQAYPGAEITLALRPYLRELAAGAGFADHVLDAPRVRSLAELRARVAEVRAGGFDTAIVLPNSFETALIPFLARVPRRFGYRQGRPGLLTAGPRVRPARPWYSRHGPRRIPTPMPEYYAALLDAIGVPAGPAAPRLAIRDEDRDAIDGWLRARGIESDRRLVLLTPGASYGASKLWLPERFAAVARSLRERADTVPVLLAGPAEVDFVRSIAIAAGGVAAAIDPVLPFGQLKALCARASLMITTDTGPRHVAVAVGVPIVCLMGPNDSRYTDYALEQQIVIQRRELPCVPCQRKVCPLGHHDCMRRIEVADVLAAADELLSRNVGR